LLSNKQPHINYTCKNCGNVFSGFYCNNCGEKIYTTHDKSLLHLLEEAFHFITHFEGTFLTTLKTIFSKPGKLSFDYCNGQRKKYFKPISFFMLVVVLYFVFPAFKGLNMNMNTYASDKYGYTWATVPIIKAKMEAKKISYTEVASLYDAKSPKVSKLLLFVYILLASILLTVLYAARKMAFFDHFILATEMISFWILFFFLLFPFFYFISNLITNKAEQWFADGSYLQDFVGLLFAIYIIAAFKNFFKGAWYIYLPKALIFIFVFGEYIRYAYNLINFYTVMALL